LDKTGTTFKQKSNVFIQQRNLEDDFIKSAVLSSLADDTPEGKSIVELAGEVANKLSNAELIL
jgi:K+-transporting ATPase ATPase B chain